MPRKQKLLKKTPRIDREKAVASTVALCKELAIMAAFQLSESPKSQEKVYRAIKTLQILAETK